MSDSADDLPVTTHDTTEATSPEPPDLTFDEEDPFLDEVVEEPAKVDVFDLKDFIEDANKCKGTWVTIDKVGGAALYLARWDNEEQTKYIRKMAQAYRQTHKVTAIPTKEYEDMTIKAAARHVLLKWRNINHNGKPVEYSPKAAYEIMKKAPVFYQLYVQYNASNLANFLVEQEEKTEKN